MSGAPISGAGRAWRGVRSGASNICFAGVDAAGNIGLWVTNGTVAGTQEIMSGAPTFQGGLKPTNLTVFRGEVYFNAGDWFWVTDGTAAGTHQLTNAVHGPSALAILVGVDVAGHTGPA